MSVCKSAAAVCATGSGLEAASPDLALESNGTLLLRKGTLPLGSAAVVLLETPKGTSTTPAFAANKTTLCYW